MRFTKCVLCQVDDPICTASVWKRWRFGNGLGGARGNAEKCLRMQAEVGNIPIASLIDAGPGASNTSFPQLLLHLMHIESILHINLQNLCKQYYENRKRKFLQRTMQETTSLNKAWTTILPRYACTGRGEALRTLVLGMTEGYQSHGMLWWAASWDDETTKTCLYWLCARSLHRINGQTPVLSIF